MSRHPANLDVYTAIADPTRRLLLQQMGDGDQTVSALANHCDTSLSAVSQHLKILHEVGLVTVRQEGRERYYRLNAAPLRPVAEWLARYTLFWNDRLDALDRYLEVEQDLNDHEGTGNREQGTEGRGKREQREEGTGNREQGRGKRRKGGKE